MEARPKKLIPRRSGTVAIPLWELGALTPREGGDPDPFAEYREVLEEAGAVLTVRRAPGVEVDAWQRQLTRARLEMRGRDAAAVKATGVPEARAEGSEDLLVDANRVIFEAAFVALSGFEDADAADSAWAGLFDFMPLLGVLIGAEILARQRPQRPES